MIRPPSLDPSYKVGKVQELKNSEPLQSQPDSKYDSKRPSGQSQHEQHAEGNPKLSINDIVQEENLDALEEIGKMKEKPQSIMHLRNRGENSPADAKKQEEQNQLNVQAIVREENLNALNEIQEVKEQPKSIMYKRDKGDNRENAVPSSPVIPSLSDADIQESAHEDNLNAIKEIEEVENKPKSIVHIRGRDDGNSSQTSLDQADQVVAYKWVYGMTIPNHGDLVDPNMLIRTRDDKPFDQSDDGLSFPIDVVHEKGWPHVGTWAFVTDSEQRLLLQKRGPTMVTCPNTWTLQGEHCNAHQGEEVDPGRAVNRGLEEEIGDFVMEYIVQEENLMKDRGSLPVFYSNEYETSLGHRVDRQFTYLWYVQLSKPGDFVIKEMERLNSYAHDEVAEMKWISIDELERLLQQGPDQFCHHTIISLLNIGIPELKKRLEQRRNQV